MEILRNTVTDEVYKILRNKILNLNYKPGRALSAAKISKEMNISRSPAREALIKLHSDNLVQIIPQVGTKVALINLNNLSEERFLRISLETSAFRKFTYNHNKNQIMHMKEIIKKQEIAIANRSIIELIALDNQFHQIVFDSISKPRCWSLLTSNNSNEYRLRLLALAGLNGTLEYVINAHEALIKYIIDKDEINVCDCLTLHLSHMNDELPQLVSNYPEIFESTICESTNKKRINKDDGAFLEKIIKNSGMAKKVSSLR